MLMIEGLDILVGAVLQMRDFPITFFAVGGGGGA
jgi:hypothetical protein